MIVPIGLSGLWTDRRVTSCRLKGRCVSATVSLWSIRSRLSQCSMVFPKDPTRDVVKRVIGLPGDVIDIDSGQVIRNGKHLDEPYVVHQDARTFDPVRVPQSSYYVLGDNRLISSDSRHWGFVPEEHIIGRAWLSYWPSDRIAFLHALW